MFQTKVVENIETHCLFNNLKKNHAIYEIMWKNVLELDRPCPLHDGYLRMPSHTQKI
jgi:hypothetical protein